MNAGRVELDLVAVGKDQVSAMLRQVDAQLKKTGGEMRTLGAQAGVAVPQIGSMIPTVADVTKKLSGMSMAIIGGVVGAAGSGVIGAITSLAGGVVDLVAEFLKSEPRIDSFSEQLIATANDAAKMTAQLTDIGTAAAAASKQVEGFGQRVNTLAARIARMRGQGDLADVYERAAEVAGTGSAIAAVEENMRKAEAAANDAAARGQALKKQVEAAQRDANAARLAIELRQSQGLSDEVQRSQLILATTGLATLSANLKMTEVAYIDASDAVRKMAEELAYLDTLQVEQGKTQKAGAEKVTKTARGGGRAGAMPDAGPTELDKEVQARLDAWDRAHVFGGRPTRGEGTSEPGAPLAAMATDAEKVRDALHQVADAIGLVSDKFPELGNALSEVSAISDQFAAGQATLAEALAAGGVAIVANAAKAVGGIKAEAAVRAAYEVGMGFATLANPVESAGHFTAAALLGAVAAGAGGGGGKKSASGGSGAGFSGGSGSSGGPTTIVNNFAMGIGDRQTITLALRQSERTSRGTGASSRAGV